MKWSFVFLLIFLVSCSIPHVASANSLDNIKSTILNLFGGSSQGSEQVTPDYNLQTVPALMSTVNFASNAAVGGGDISTTDDGESLVADSGPAGTLADIGDTVNTGQISNYVVRKGDSLGSVAKMYGVTTNTIIWANNLNSNTIKEGESLIILPVSGTIHTVAKGDTLKTVAKKYKADAVEIAQFNGLDSSSSLTVGDIIIIPDGEGTTRASAVTTVKTSGKGTSPYLGGGGPSYLGYYMRPIAGGVKTQGLHGYNAIDIGTPVGTTLHAAAEGQVIIAKSSGWNGGYGEYVVISHYNGTQTVYGHMSKVYVNVGDTVSQGQVIGLTGNTGNSTGPHLHFEVRGAYNFMNDASEY